MKMTLFYEGTVVIEVSDYGEGDAEYDRAVAEAKSKFPLPPGAEWVGSQAEPNSARKHRKKVPPEALEELGEKT